MRQEVQEPGRSALSHSFKAFRRRACGQGTKAQVEKRRDPNLRPARGGEIDGDLAAVVESGGAGEGAAWEVRAGMEKAAAQESTYGSSAGAVKMVEIKDFVEWLSEPENLRELSDEIGANWVLVKRFLVWELMENGFYVLSKREIEAIKRDARGGKK